MSEVALARISHKGRIEIPDEIWKGIDFEYGSTVAVFGDDDTIIIKKIKLPSGHALDDLYDWGEEQAKHQGVDEEEFASAIEEIKRDEMKSFFQTFLMHVDYFKTFMMIQGQKHSRR
jgi:bifunctional DNA-binding transcriptional regulator/antitoxin component of YhaV-PrlF toxin-antitoxin module